MTNKNKKSKFQIWFETRKMLSKKELTKFLKEFYKKNKIKDLFN